MMNSVTDWLIGGGGAVFVLSMIAWLWPKKKRDPRTGERWREPNPEDRPMGLYEAALYGDKATRTKAYESQLPHLDLDVRKPKVKPPKPVEVTTVDDPTPVVSKPPEPEPGVFTPCGWRIVDNNGSQVAKIKHCKINIGVDSMVTATIEAYLLDKGRYVNAVDGTIAIDPRATQSTDRIYHCYYCNKYIAEHKAHATDHNGLIYCSHLCLDRQLNPNKYRVCE